MICGSLVTDIISKMGGQCFFICKLPKIKALERKKGSKFDTTQPLKEVNIMKALMTLKELLEEYYTSFKVGYTR